MSTENVKTLVDIPRNVKDRLKARALREGRTFGDLVREALKNYANGRNAAPARKRNNNSAAVKPQ